MSSQSPNRKLIRIGTRGSALALTQTEFVKNKLTKKFPHLIFEVVVIKTTGDKIRRPALFQIGGKGLFIKEIEEALLDEKIDLAVHSLKDLPTQLQKKLAIGAILRREDPHDCLISLSATSLKGLPKNSKIGTSSLRRQAQILSLRPDLKVENLRGNLDSRIRKLKEGFYDAIVVALAGLKRLTSSSFSKAGGLEGEFYKRLKISPIPYSQMLPAAGQGAIAVEIRAEDREMALLTQMLHHQPTALLVSAERKFLEGLAGGCQLPAGIVSKVIGKRMVLEGMVASPSGTPLIRKKISGPLEKASDLGKQLAQLILSIGGREILKSIHSSSFRTHISTSVQN